MKINPDPRIETWQLPWSTYKPSTGRGREEWLVIEERADGSFIEALVVEDKSRPIVIQHVHYGPRGGVRIHEAATEMGVELRIKELRDLQQIVRILEAKRP